MYSKKNIVLKVRIRQLLFLITISLFFLLSACNGSKYAQSSRHRKPVSTGKRNCGCSLLSPTYNHTVKLYQPWCYDVQA